MTMTMMMMMMMVMTRCSSRVDETLFGPAHREVDHGTRCRGTAELWIDEGIRLDERKPSRVQHVTKDLVRDLM